MPYNDFDNFLETLGFEGAPYRSSEDPQISLTKIRRAKLLVLTPPLSAEALDLARKMFSVMKIPEALLHHLEIEGGLDAVETTLRDSTRICLVMGFDLAGAVLSSPATGTLRGRFHRPEAWHPVPVWVTHSPEDVIHDISLKRPVWDDLQEIMKRFLGREGN